MKRTIRAAVLFIFGMATLAYADIKPEGICVGAPCAVFIAVGDTGKTTIVLNRSNWGSISDALEWMVRNAANFPVSTDGPSDKHFFMITWRKPDGSQLVQVWTASFDTSNVCDPTAPIWLRDEIAPTVGIRC